MIETWQSTVYDASKCTDARHKNKAPQTRYTNIIAGEWSTWNPDKLDFVLGHESPYMCERCGCWLGHEKDEHLPDDYVVFYPTRLISSYSAPLRAFVERTNKIPSSFYQHYHDNLYIQLRFYPVLTWRYCIANVSDDFGACTQSWASFQQWIDTLRQEQKRLMTVNRTVLFLSHHCVMPVDVIDLIILYVY